MIVEFDVVFSHIFVGEDGCTNWERNCKTLRGNSIDGVFS
jgi:hypothetical protein